MTTDLNDNLREIYSFSVVRFAATNPHTRCQLCAMFPTCRVQLTSIVHDPPYFIGPPVVGTNTSITFLKFIVHLLKVCRHLCVSTDRLRMHTQSRGALTHQTRALDRGDILVFDNAKIHFSTSIRVVRTFCA